MNTATRRIGKNWSAANLEGQVFHRLTVKARIGSNANHHVIWECACQCGNATQVTTYKLKSGHTRSCGCLRAERLAVGPNRTHGLTNTPEYAVWSSMLARCNNPKCPAYPDYGGRGIRASDEWHMFSNFIADMGRRPTSRHTLERRDNDLGYCKSNCSWETRHVQSRNNRRNRVLAFNGKSLCVADWATELGIPSTRIRNRLHRGFNTEESLSLTTPKRQRS